jgi:hypothetical protein
MRAGGDRIPTPDERLDKISDSLNKMIERIDYRFSLREHRGSPDALVTGNNQAMQPSSPGSV